MTFSTMSVPNTYTFGNSEVNFSLSERKALSVTIDTKRLHIRSVTSSEEDCSSCADLFSSQEVMEKFADGQTRTSEETEDRINDVWVKRWEKNDPYSSLVVFEKDTDDFLGHVTIGHSGTAGQSELAYLFKNNHWDRGFGTEAVTAVVKEYAPATIAEGYTLDGKPLEKITATARPDNPASVKILEKIGMHKTKEEEKYGSLRHHFSIDLKLITEPFTKE